MGKEIKVEANIENLEKVAAFLDEQLDAVGCPMKIHSQIHLVRKMTDAMDYSYENGQNVLVVWKNINGG